MKGVFVAATVFGTAQSLIFFLYAAGYVFSAYLVVEGRNTYEDVFRWVHLFLVSWSEMEWVDHTQLF